MDRNGIGIRKDGYIENRVRGKKTKKTYPS